MTRRDRFATLALFVALAVVHTWPLASAPARYWRDTGDYRLNAWALAWIAHQLPREPSALFHANIFHPERWTLAFSEHLLPQAVFAAPVIWCGGSPVLGYNVSVLAGLALTGWATALMIARWTGRTSAGVLAGCLAAFNAKHLVSFAHLQSLHVMYLPLALLALDRLLTAGRVRHALLTGAGLALQALTSSYWVVFSAIAATGASAVRASEWWPRPLREAAAWRRAALLALAALTAVVLLAPVLYPYWQVRQAHNFRRPIRDAAMYSASASDFLRGNSRLHTAIARRIGPPPRRMRTYQFPGVTALLLTGVAIGTGLAWRDPRARMLAAIAASGAVLAFGPSTPVYRWLYDVGLLENMRVASRFGGLVFFGVAGLAGFGLARALQWRRLAGPAWKGLTAAVLVIAAANAEALRAPMAWDEVREVSRVYRVIAGIPGAVVVEIPFYPPRMRARNAVYFPGAMVHWKPMVNGYSGFLPVSYIRLWEAGMNRFPGVSSLDALQHVGVTHAVVHRNRLGRRADRTIARLEKTRRVELLIADGDVRLYRLLPQR